MKLLNFLLPLACLIFANCSTTDLYYKPLTQRPSIPWKDSSASWGGYIETRKNSSITIRYEAYNKPTAEAASYFAMLRAAERSLIDGKTHFYITRSLKLNSRSEQSYFPPYTIPGYWVTESYDDCDACSRGDRDGCCGDCYEQVWYPAQYIPEQYVMNYVHTAELSISYTGKSSQRRDARAIALRALADSAGYGKPKLDPKAMRNLTPSKASAAQ